MRKLATWFFTPPAPPLTPLGALRWWELRRIPFNLVIAVYGLLCFAVFLWAILGSHTLQPGEDAIEPLAIIMAPFFVNVAFTFGWLVEVPVRLVRPSLGAWFGPFLLRLGLGLAVFLITLPAAWWSGFRVLQLLGVIR